MTGLVAMLRFLVQYCWWLLKLPFVKVLCVISLSCYYVGE